jgi:hypothetical protein
MGKNYISSKYFLEASSALLKYLVPKATQAKIKALHLGQKVFLDQGLQMGFLNK